MSELLAEHLGYLADSKRLDHFRAAIARAIKPGDVVADVGCGFGVLGLLCLQAGAARVWGIDETPALEVARETMARAGFSDRYRCISGRSFDVELPERVDVVICDHVGYLGFDYGVIELMADAKRRFLKPGGTLLPAGLTLQIAGCASPAARALADAWVVRDIPEHYRWLRDHGINTKHARSFAAHEILGTPTTLGTIDLSSEPAGHISFKAEIQIDRDGVLDGFVGWFECTLFRDVGMTNSPLAEGRIDRDQAYLPIDRPLPVIKGQRLKVTLSARPADNVLAWTLESPEQTARSTYTTWKSRILSPNDLARQREDRVAKLSQKGLARRTVLGYCDGQRSVAEIADALLHDHPDLFPTPEGIRQFVRTELSRNLE